MQAAYFISCSVSLMQTNLHFQTIGVLTETSVATSLTYSHCQVEASPFEVLLSVEGRAGHVGAARCGENTHLV